jgi:hypothetical protein
VTAWDRFRENSTHPPHREAFVDAWRQFTAAAVDPPALVVEQYGDSVVAALMATVAAGGESAVALLADEVLIAGAFSPGGFIRSVWGWPLEPRGWRLQYRHDRPAQPAVWSLSRRTGDAWRDVVTLEA